MPKFWIAIYHPNDYNPAVSESEQMGRDIDILNDEMVAAGIRVFVGGLQPTQYARSLVPQPTGEVTTSDGPFLQTDEHVGGFWVLEVANLEEATEWGLKAATACRVPVHVRPFH